MGGKCVRLWEWWRDKAHRHEACRHGVHCWLADWVRGSAALIFPSAWQLDRFPPLPFSSPSLHLRTTTFCHYPGKPWIAWSLGTGGRGPLPVHVCAHVCMCVHMHMCTCVYMPVVRVRTHACKCVYMYICRCVYSSMCACMRLYKHLHVYLYRLVILSSLFFHLLAWPLHLSLKFSLHLAFKYHSLCCCWSTYSLIMTPSSWHIWALLVPRLQHSQRLTLLCLSNSMSREWISKAGPSLSHFCICNNYYNIWGTVHSHNK